MRTFTPGPCRGCPHHRLAGFTLIELLVTLTILAVLALFTAPVAEVAVQRANENELRHALRDIRDAIAAFKNAYDEGHIARTVQATGYPKTLEVLVDGVEDAKASMTYSRPRMPRD